MKVLFLMLDLPNEIGSSNLYLDLALEFYDNGHNVFIIAPSLNSKKNSINIEFGMKVLRVKSMKQKGIGSIFLKGLAQTLLPFQFKKAYKQYLSKESFDLILMPTPPITLINAASYIKKSNNAKLYLILRDIYPQGAADIGLVKSKLMYNYLRYLEIKTYKTADIIGCMSPKNIDFILKNNPFVNKENLTLLPNWQKDMPLLDSLSKTSTVIKQKYGLENKFIVLFGGTIGYAQRVENIIKLGIYCSKYEDVRIVIIGSGVKKKYLQQLVSTHKLKNVYFFDQLPRDEYIAFAKLADIGLITIDERFTVPTIPSKTVTYFSLSLPILAVIDAHTDYPDLLAAANAGIWSIGGDDEDMYKNFDILYNNRKLRIEMGKCGYLYFLNHLTATKAYTNIMNQIKEYL